MRGRVKGHPALRGGPAQGSDGAMAHRTALAAPREPRRLDPKGGEPRPTAVAPGWFLGASAALTLSILVMAVAETNLWIHFLVDTGEYLSLVGLVFAVAIGLLLYRRGQLAPSLPLFVPWLLWPVLTQADQIIDNLTIGQMRLVCHVILAILFAAPIAVLALAARRVLEPTGPARSRPRRWTALFPGLRRIEAGETRAGTLRLVMTLLLVEIALADRYLGAIMLFVLIAGGLLYLLLEETAAPRFARVWKRAVAGHVPLGLLLLGIVASVGLYLGFKNRPGAYQGSPHYFHDPANAGAAYALDRIPVPATAGGADAAALERAGAVLAGYADALATLARAYHLLDRNYNYAFHNALFLRSTPTVPQFRDKGLEMAAQARGIALDADARFDSLLPALDAHGALASLLGEVRAYVAHNLGRSDRLASMSDAFDDTEAGLQHATHLYEGEGKVLGEQLVAILNKHRRVLELPSVATVAGPFLASSRDIHGLYANRIVGF